MKKQLLFILLFLPAFLTAKEIRYFVQPGEILDLSENAFERHGIKVSMDSALLRWEKHSMGI